MSETRSRLTFDSADAAGLASSVRELARDSHQLLRDPNATFGDLRNLHGKVAVLRARLNQDAPGPLVHWLENLAMRVERHELAGRLRSGSRRETGKRPVLAGKAR